MTLTKRHLHIAVALALLAASTTTAWLIACADGPFFLLTVNHVHPGNIEAFTRGELGVVRPPFARRYLVQAYRRMSGQPAVPETATTEVTGLFWRPKEADEWLERRDAILSPNPSAADKPAREFSTTRNVGNYQYIENCLQDAFVSAVRTLAARSEKFGATSSEVREWVRAQDAVFSNCGGEGLILPEPAPSSADPLVKADREYQTASAYFYAAQYEEAARRFRAIAADTRSPWRPYGRYLAARAAIREATVGSDAAVSAARFLTAEADLNAVLDDSSAKALHASARGLLQFIAARVDPMKRFAELSAILGTSRNATDQEFVDYQRLFDRLVSDVTEYEYAKLPNRQELAESGELTDWMLAMQGSGEEAVTRAAAQWKRTRSLPWLVAFLWNANASHPDLNAALDAASRVERSSPAFATLAFLRVRQLHAKEDAAGVRRLLSTLPSKPEPGFPAETINLFAAARFRRAADLAELLANAPRTIVTSETGEGQLAFDADAAAVFSARLPLERLIEAAQATQLPNRLRVRIAAAAFTRAMMLDRTADAARVTGVLEALAPSLRADLKRYASAQTAADRNIAVVLMLLRTPGLDVDVRGLDDFRSIEQTEPSREFDDAMHLNWWCLAGGTPVESSSETLQYFWGSDIPFPSFITASERAAVKKEIDAINAQEPVPNFLANEAVKWARARPTDPDAAEALALAVRAARWGCGDDKTTRAGRTAFETLHKVFPKSEWAQKTKYWYESTGNRRSR